MSYQNKYLKYKNKYLDLKNQIGGSTINNSSTDTDAPSCSVCLIEFNNTDRKPVALHNTINATNVETSTEHFVCLMCYNMPEIKNRLTCMGCNDSINKHNAKICNYDTDKHRIATPFVSVPVIPPYIYPRMKQFKRTYGIYFNEGGRGGMQTYYELYEFRCTCGNVETNCACKATAPERLIRELSEAEYNQLDIFADQYRYR
jgi:hypothetical protein